MAREKTSKQDLIAKAAIKIFASKGYHPSRTVDISQEAGVAYGTLYQHFDSKEDILLHIFRQSWENIVEAVKRVAGKDIAPEDKIHAVIDMIFRSYQNNPDLMKVLIIEVPRLTHFYSSDSQELYNKLFIHLAEIFDEGRRSGQFREDISPMIASFIAYGAIDTTIRQWSLNSAISHGEQQMKEAISQIMNFLMKGYLKGA